MNASTRGSRKANAQRGATLVVALIFLLLLTLLAVSAIRLGNTNLRVAGNVQAQAEGIAAAQQAIETVMNSGTNFVPVPLSQTVAVDVNNDGTTDYSIVVPAPDCLLQAPVPGWDTISEGFAPKISYWDVTATATATATGATVTVHEGVRANVGADATCP